jgi:hypothetical protein
MKEINQFDSNKHRKLPDEEGGGFINKTAMSLESAQEDAKRIQEKKKDLQFVLRDIERKIKVAVGIETRNFEDMAVMLERAGRPDLAELAGEIFLEDNLRIVLTQELQIGYVGHRPAHGANYFLMIKDLIHDEKFLDIGRSLVEIRAAFKESDGAYKDASDLYERIGMNEKAQKLKAKHEERSNDYGETGFNSNIESDFPYYHAIRDVRKKFENYELMTEEEKEQIVQRIKSEVSAEIASL